METLEQILLNAVPILLAGVGVLFTELAGVLNIGIEGLMILGAFLSLATVVLTGSPFLGMLAAVLGGLAGGWLLAFVHLRYRANVFIAGLALNLLAWGLVPVLGSLLLGVRGVLSLQQLGIPLAPVRDALVPILVLAALALPASWYVLRRTRVGIGYRALHANPQGLEQLGISPVSYKRNALILSGALAGLAGLFLAYRLGAYVPNISAGRGWISLVVVFLGNMNPLGMGAASLVFSAAEHLASQAQEGFALPGLLIGLPYFLTLLALVFWAALKKIRGKNSSGTRPKRNKGQGTI